MSNSRWHAPLRRAAGLCWGSGVGRFASLVVPGLAAPTRTDPASALQAARAIEEPSNRVVALGHVAQAILESQGR